MGTSSSNRRLAFLAALAIAAGGCALIAGVDDRTGTFCTAEAHDLCEDFDNPKAAFPWNGAGYRADPGVEAGVVPGGRSPPNAYASIVPAQTTSDPVGAVFRNEFDHGASHMRAGFKFFIDALDLPPSTSPLDDAGSNLTPGSLLLMLVQWDTGEIVVVLRANDELDLVHAPRDPTTGLPVNGTVVRLNQRNTPLRRAWNEILLEVDLTSTPPALSIVRGPDGPQTLTLSDAEKAPGAHTEVIFGPLAFGPIGQAALRIDDLQVDFH